MATILIDNTCIVTTCQVLTFSKKKETNKIWLFYRASLDGARQALSTTSVLVTNHVSLTESTEIGVSIVGYRNASSLECPGMVSETTTYEWGQNYVNIGFIFGFHVNNLSTIGIYHSHIYKIVFGDNT